MNKVIKNIILHPLFSGTAIMLIGSNAVNGLNYLYHFSLGRLLGPADYGEVASLVSLSGLLAIIPASISLAVIKYVSIAETEEDKVILINWLKKNFFLLSAVTCAVIIVLASVIKSFMHISNTVYIIVVAVSFLFSSQALLNRSALQGLLKFKEMIISILTETSTKVVVSILLVYLGYQLNGAMAALIVSAVVGWYLSNIYLKTTHKENLRDPSNINSMSLYIIPIILQTLALTSLYSSDLVLVKHFFSSHDAGIYAALSTLGKIIFFGAGPISAVMFPLVSQHQAKGYEYIRILLYSFLVTLFFSLFILIIYWVFPEFAITLLYGKTYLEAAELLIWFGAFITLFTLSSLLVNYHLSLGNTRVIFLPLIAAVIQILGIWFYHESLFSVILVSILVTALLLGCLLIYSIRNFKIAYEKKNASRNKFSFSNSACV